MKNILSIFFLLILTPLIYAQKYAVGNIPLNLKENAHAVTREELMHILIKDPEKAIVQKKVVVTVLDERGISDGVFQEFYNNLVGLNDIEGVLYDAQGNKIKSMKKKDIKDLSFESDENLITDGRYKEHNFYWSSYPYTVEYTYEQEFKSLFLLQDWIPASYNLSIEHAELIVECPINYNIRLNGIYLPKPIANPIVYGKIKKYTYSMDQFSAQEKEPLSNKGILNNLPKIIIAPSDFMMGKYSGNMNDWKQYGLFQYGLYKAKDHLPEKIKQEVHRLTDNILSQQKKAEILYQYLQNNTRYISVQLGIGGWEPFDATYVAAKSYGDCKALTNYMYSLLKEAGIKSYPVLINAGDQNTEYLLDDFANNYFNHVILCIPQGNDSIWLECTSQTSPFGYLSAFTANRKALMLTEEGGIIVQTPNYSPTQNLQKRISIATIDKEGNLLADLTTLYQGEQQDYIFGLLHNTSKEVLKKYLNNNLSLDTYEVINSQYNEKPSSLPSVEERLKINAPNFASVVGKRIFFTPNAFNKSDAKFDLAEKRNADIIFTYPFLDIDSTLFNIPEGYEIEAFPKDVLIESEFGTYTTHYEFKEGKIFFIRSQKRLSGKYPPNLYTPLVHFFDKIYKLDREKVVLRKKDI